MNGGDARQRKERESITNFEKIAETPEALGEFLASLPVADGPWDVEFRKAFCAKCERCKEFARIMGIPPKLYKNIPNDDPCPDWRQYFKVDPPTGEGYQLWGTTSEGEPRSPVFKTPEELAEWCAENDTVFGNIRATKEEWLEMIKKDMIAAKVDGVLYL